MTTEPARGRAGGEAFRHDAYLYAGEDAFLRGIAGFIREASAAGEPVLVAVAPRKIDLLRAELRSDADGVVFADMEAVGANPARIIPLWRDFVDGHAREGLGVRGVGEPVWPGRGPAELAECRRHESLLNLAFAGGRPWWLLCPYDTDALPPSVIADARRTHPSFGSPEGRTTNPDFVDDAAEPFAAVLPAPPAHAVELPFALGALDRVRTGVAGYAAAAGLDDRRISDLVLAAHEVATNSVLHGGGAGVLRIWHDHTEVICDVRDRGRLGQPLAGRQRPPPDRIDGRGLWLANHLCDLVQLRSLPSGTAVRLHVRFGSEDPA